MDREEIHLIVGLGNPGETYKETRHNVGFDVVRAFARKNGFTFKASSQFFGEVAMGKLQEKRVLLLQPTTYMNESGIAVRRCVDYYKVSHEHLIVVNDDVALPLGMMRIRASGSHGGHNGLKSIEAHLNTDHYPRFRIGVGSPVGEDLSDFVLGKFAKEERSLIEDIVPKAVNALEIWVTVGIAAAMRAANAQKIDEKENSGDKKNGQAEESSL